MSKKQKLEDRLFGNPKPTDFRWNELLSVMHKNGFSEHCNGGSHYIFQHTNGLTVTISKTHPGGILKGYQIDAAKEAITKVSPGVGGSHDN